MCTVYALRIFRNNGDSDHEFGYIQECRNGSFRKTFAFTITHTEYDYRFPRRLIKSCGPATDSTVYKNEMKCIIILYIKLYSYIMCISYLYCKITVNRSNVLFAMPPRFGSSTEAPGSPGRIGPGKDSLALWLRLGWKKTKNNGKKKGCRSTGFGL